MQKAGPKYTRSKSGHICVYLQWLLVTNIHMHLTL